MEDKDKPSKASNNLDYQRITSKLFYNSLINIPLFAVPAFTGLFLGKYLDARFATNKTFTIILLFLALVTSWFFVLRKNAKLTREYKEVRAQMKKEELEKNEAKN